MDANFSLSGKCVCITGETKLDRHMLWALIAACGGRWVTSVSSLVDVLVCGETPGPRKLMMAELHQTPICNEEELESVIRRDLDYPTEKGTLFALAWRLPYQNKEKGTNPVPRSSAPRAPRVPEGDGPLRGMNIVLTGTLSRPRKEIEQMISRAGGLPMGAISGTTSYLVAGEGGGSKREKAAKLNIPIIDEAALLAMINAE